MVVGAEEERGVVESFRGDAFAQVKAFDSGMAEGGDEGVTEEVVVVLESGGQSGAAVGHLGRTEDEDEGDGVGGKGVARGGESAGDVASRLPAVGRRAPNRAEGKLSVVEADGVDVFGVGHHAPPGEAVEESVEGNEGVAHVFGESFGVGNAGFRCLEGAAHAVHRADGERRHQKNRREGLVEGRAHQKLK